MNEMARSQHLIVRVSVAASALTFVLAAGHRADASIIYTQVNVVIANDSYDLDLTNDGHTDFSLTSWSVNGYCTTYPYNKPNEIATFTAMREDHRNGVVVEARHGYAFALTAGSEIGPGSIFGGPEMESLTWGWWGSGGQCTYKSETSGDWLGVEGRYLGVRFAANGEIHYGWAQLNVTFKPLNPITATLSGYAYETIAGKSIMAGQT